LQVQARSNRSDTKVIRGNAGAQTGGKRPG